MLAVVATDRTFERHVLGDRPVWVGKCIHCGRKLTVADDGAPISQATLEHIWPRTHGGDNALRNLALACAGCNREKGGRHDNRHRADERLGEIVAELRRRREERWRDPADVGLADRIARVLDRSIEGDDDEDDSDDA
jgi:5-methylcytosine-specific restriction endonuclease McrA